MSTRWLQVNTDEFEKKHTRVINGVKISVYLSPYDIPESVRGYYDEQKDRFVIELRYLGEEPTQRISEDSSVIAIVGKRSQRLYGFEIDVNRLGVQSVMMHTFVGQQINELARASRKPKDDYSAAKSTLYSRWGELTEAIPH